ncbi:hypothetical protein KR044_006601, partial [Drosophila immigrans]
LGRVSGTPQGRVVGGSQVKVGEWPWMASIQNLYGFDFCGGVVIDDVWILTAASCVSGLRARNLIVVTGTVDTWNMTSPYYFVDQIHVHCNFDQPLYHNDIALLHVNETIEFNAETAKIALSEVDELQEGEKLSFAGWGSSSESGTRSQYLQKSEGSYVAVEKCRSTLGNTDDVDVGHVCVQMDEGKGSCYGDTGGPLIDEQGQLVGVGNWGVPCGRGYPDVYARVAFYNDWIRTIINGSWEYYTEEIIIHCKFDQPLYHNDIALIKMQTLVAYDEVTQNITLAGVDDLVEGDKLTMTGWGNEDETGEYVFDLKQLELSYVPPSKCNSTYGNTQDLDVGHLCAVGKVGAGACYGDQGGPLVDSQGRLVGIGNWGVPCGRGFPDVFARVSYYYDWIQSHING